MQNHKKKKKINKTMTMIKESNLLRDELAKKAL